MAWLPDEIHDFYEDCKDKKSTAQSARHARSHCGKGGRVKFASDYMTKKEREAMNGECKSYRMNDPMSWEEFKQLPDDLKVIYISALRKKYNVTDAALAEMLGIDRTWFKRMVVNALKLDGGKPGHRVWDKEGFYAWWHGAKGDAVKPSETPVEEDVEDSDETPVEEDVEEEDAEVTEYDYDALMNIDEKLVEGGVTEVTDELVAVNEEPEIKVVEEETCSYAPDCMKKKIRDAGPIAFAGNSLPVIPTRGTLKFDNNIAEDALETVKTLLGSMRVSMTITWFPAE